MRGVRRPKTSSQNDTHRQPTIQEELPFAGPFRMALPNSPPLLSPPTDRLVPLAPRRIQSECNLSHHGDDVLSSTGTSGEGSRRRFGLSRWFRRVGDWMSTSEPSAKAMKSERNRAQKKDSQSAKNVHYIGGHIPEGIITSTSGPMPEKALRDSMRDSALRRKYLTGSPTCQSLASSGSFSPSVREFSIREGSNLIAPWEDVP